MTRAIMFMSTSQSEEESFTHDTTTGDGMWVDADLVAHTVSPPDWRLILTVAGEISKENLEELADKVEVARDDIYWRVMNGAIGPGGPVERLPSEPIALPASVFADPQLLVAQLDEVDEWWRLDLLDALESYLDELAGAAS